MVEAQLNELRVQKSEQRHKVKNTTEVAPRGAIGNIKLRGEP